jgi:hypothetical protein
LTPPCSPPQTPATWPNVLALLATLRDLKIMTIDESAQQLAGALASTYLDVKQRGIL